jgi:hypothetical protein
MSYFLLPVNPPRDDLPTMELAKIGGCHPDQSPKGELEGSGLMHIFMFVVRDS